MTRTQEMQPAIFDDLEPDACEYCDERNPPNQMFQASIAVSLKRIADRLEGFDLAPIGNQLLEIAYQAGVNFRGRA
jgi:hypothetical protein